MVGLSDTLYNQLKQSHNGFMFIGGITYYLDDEYETSYANELLKIAQKSVSGDYDRLFFKGHPSYISDKFNQFILKNIDNIIEIPKDIPIEVLFLTGLCPNKVGGVNSSSYFLMPQEKLSHIVFTDPKYYTYSILNTDFIKILLRLGCIKEEQIFSWYDFIE